MKKFVRLIFLLFIFCLFWPTGSQAELEVINTDFFHTLTKNGITIDLVSFAPSINQWVVVMDEVDGYQQIGIYPNNQPVSYTIRAKLALEYQPLDAVEWLAADGVIIQDKQIRVRPAPIAKQWAQSDDGQVVLNIKPDQAAIELFTVDTSDQIGLASEVYKISSQVLNYQIKFYYQADDSIARTLYSYDQVGGVWQPLKSYHNPEENFLTLDIKNQAQDLIIAIVADGEAYDGVASFYNQARYRAFNYKNGNFAASTIYPKGTKLKVTRILTGQSVVVTVNDYGPESRTGRLIDLDISAFKKIGSTRAGIIYVRVEPYDQAK
ncbi:MAG: septal ring lytic transglycosylase RlpA family protein [Patescibacteria group bacterium]